MGIIIGILVVVGIFYAIGWFMNDKSIIGDIVNIVYYLFRKFWYILLIMLAIGIIMGVL